VSHELGRFDAAVELATRIAAGDLESRVTASDAGDELDALITALNMVAEELGHERRMRFQAEELLADELEAYERAPALFCSLDGDTFFIDKCNQTLADALELPKDRILGNSMLTLCALACQADAERLLRESVLDGPANNGELRVVTASKRTLIVATSVSRVRAANGERLRLVGKDVTTERHLEEQLLQAQKMEAFGRLSGGVAHDFNNILAVIMTASEFLRETLLMNQLPVEDAQTILDASARGAALTSDLLAFSRQRLVKLGPTDVRTSVHETQRMLERLVGAHIRIVANLPNEPVVCLVDPSQISQVLLNLALNGRDAMPGGGTLRFEVSRVELDSAAASARLELSPGAYALLAVSDTGTGMSPQVATQAFEPFFTTKPVGQGTGLGLSTCYGIVHQAGGRISIYSEVGSGTTVKVYLPLVDELAPGEPRRAETAKHGTETILVVEDDSGLRALTKRILLGAGYQVFIASNGREALEIIESSRRELALVVTDVMMPEMGGQELASVLQRTRPNTRILYVSGFTANVVVAEGGLEPGVAFIAKPFSSQALLTTVRQLLDQRRG